MGFLNWRGMRGKMGMAGSLSIPSKGLCTDELVLRSTGKKIVSNHKISTRRKIYHEAI
jgi:hypothetical protein